MQERARGWHTWVLLSSSSRSNDCHRKGDVSVLSSPLLWLALADRRDVYGMSAQHSKDSEHRHVKSGIPIYMNLIPDSLDLPFSH